MKRRDYATLLYKLTEAFTLHSPISSEIHQEGKQFLIDGGSHALRIQEPFPPRIHTAQGAWVKDVDGHDILDFWQGHLTNILGHNSKIVTQALAQAFDDRYGLQTGIPESLQVEVAEILCKRTGSERVRLTTSGALATMYSIFLARAYSGRRYILKIGGGWHGAHPWALKGVKFHSDMDAGFSRLESEGLPSTIDESVLVTRFNDTDMLEDVFKEVGENLACIIVEPLVGSGGIIPASLEFLRTARDLTREYGALLILDEVITGFRFRAGDVADFYGIQSDLSIFGKAIGGGMPIAAVGGRKDIMELVGRAGGRRVAFNGGTFSAHPASLIAAKANLTHLVAEEATIYSHLARLGESLRRATEDAFAEEGIHAICTGNSNEAIPGSSLFMIHFPYEDNVELSSPEIVHDPEKCDIDIRRVLQVAFLLENIHIMDAHGAVSTAHTANEITQFIDTCKRIARTIRKHR